MYSHISNHEGGLDVRSMFQKAGLLYEVEKRRLGYLDDDGNFVPSTIKRNHTLKVVNSPTEFDGVSKKWKCCQNTELVDWIESTVRAFGLTPYAAGAFEGGEDAGKIGWFQARLPGEHNLFGYDRYDPLLTVTNQQKYGTTWSGGFSATRIICRNAFHAAESSLQIKVNHRQVFDVEYVDGEIKKVAAQWIGYKEKMEYLATRRLAKDESIVEYFKEIFSTIHTDKDKNPRAVDVAKGALAEQPGVEFKEGSMYQAFTAVTYTIDHLLGKDSKKRALNAQYGGGAARKVAALKAALKIADRQPVLA